MGVGEGMGGARYKHSDDACCNIPWPLPEGTDNVTRTVITKLHEAHALLGPPARRRRVRGCGRARVPLTHGPRPLTQRSQTHWSVTHKHVCAP